MEMGFGRVFEIPYPDPWGLGPQTETAEAGGRFPDGARSGHSSIRIPCRRRPGRPEAEVAEIHPESCGPGELPGILGHGQNRDM